MLTSSPNDRLDWAREVVRAELDKFRRRRPAEEEPSADGLAAISAAIGALMLVEIAHAAQVAAGTYIGMTELLLKAAKAQAAQQAPRPGEES